MDILLKVGFIEIRWYSILILFAFILGYLLVVNEAKKHNIKKSLILDLVCYLIPICIIGARLYYVIFEWNYYSNNLIDIFKIWEGGLAIHGGIIAGFLFLIYFTKKHKINLFELTDMIVPALIIGQAIGRWGNFFNQEAYGPLTTYSFLNNLHIPNFIIEGMRINNNYYQPTFLYESIWCIIGFIILILMKKIKKLKIGQLTSIYLVYYGLGRFLIESLRQDSLIFLNLKIAQLVSIFMIIMGIILFIKSFKNNNYNLKYR